MEQQTHRPGIFKQPNKRHKGDSISARSEKKGGRQAPKVVTKKKHKQQLDKKQRRNQMAIQRKAKREEVLNQKRSRGHDDTPPFLVAIVPLSRSIDSSDVLNALKLCPDVNVMEGSRVCHVNSLRLKQRFAFLKPATDDIGAILDAAKAADCLLLCLSIQESLGHYADHVLTCLFAQGLPSVIFCAQGLKSLPIKKQSEAKKEITKHLEKRFPDIKVHSLDDEMDALLLLRGIGCQKLAKMQMREYRPHLLANEMTFEPSANDSTVGTLKVTGYLCGQALNVDQVIHIPGFGDFQLLQIDSPYDPHRLSSRCKDISEVKVLEEANVETRTPLQPLLPVDPLSQEQTWPTEEELMEAEEERMQKKEKKMIRKQRVQKGISEYQAVWMENSIEFESKESSSEDDDDDDDDEDMEGGFDDPMKAVSESSSSGDEKDAEDVDDEEKQTDTMSVAASEYDRKVQFASDEDEMKKFKEARLDQMFPDEIEIPSNESAKVFLQDYRGLASFRTSPWLHAEEDCPIEYERIAIVPNFNSVRKALLKSLKKSDDHKECHPGRYLTLHIDKVPADVIHEYGHQHPLVVFGLLKGEHYLTVVNMVLQRFGDCEDVIESDEPMIFHIGYRRFSASPVYSQHTNGDKHKMERFFWKDNPVVATVYAPIIFPPASVLMFKQLRNGKEKLVATGRVLSVDPNRVIIERAVLSGHPFKLNKKSAVVRYMFFNRDDILWFKPVELRTKNGRRGSILEPLGTHGHMKCHFNGSLDASDVVLMNLYKRVFPKLTYNARVPLPCASASYTETLDSDMEIFD